MDLFADLPLAVDGIARRARGCDGQAQAERKDQPRHGMGVGDDGRYVELELHRVQGGCRRRGRCGRRWGGGTRCRLRGCALDALNGVVVGLHRVPGGLRGARSWSCTGGEARGDLGGGLRGADQPEDLGDLAEDEGHLRRFEARAADESVAHDSDVGQPAAQAGIGLENGPAVASASGEHVDLGREVVQVELPGGFPVPC